MILGLIAGRWLREASPKVPMQRLLLAGVIGVAAGALLHFTGICPVVKRIWTPSWTLFSGGLCFLYLAIFSWIEDVKGYRKWAFPLVVIGMNSIAAYLIAHLFDQFIFHSLLINLREAPFQIFGVGLEPFVLGATVLFIYWLILYWMYGKKLFLRV
jgi:predicted acyltransferase